MDGASREEIETYANGYLGKSISDAFLERFGTELQALTLQNHRMLLVAPRLDSTAERMINYLAERHNVNINAIFFRYAKTAQGDEILIRTVLVPDTVRGVAPQQPSFTEAALIALANEHKTTHLVQACRLKPLGSNGPWEQCARTYKGSFRYWFKGKMIFGINVSGGRRNPPVGELDVWIPVPSLGGVTTVPESTIRQGLQQDFEVIEAGTTDFVVRLKSREKADALAAHLRNWVKAQPPADDKEVYLDASTSPLSPPPDISAVPPYTGNPSLQGGEESRRP